MFTLPPSGIVVEHQDLESNKRAKLVRKATPASCAMTLSEVPTDRQLKIATMMDLAEECGFACEALTAFYAEMGSRIGTRLVHRCGMNVYQSVEFSLPFFPKQAALNVFGIATCNLTEDRENQLTWKFKDVNECAHVIKPLLATLPSSSLCEGLSRALLTTSEVTSLVVATIMPSLESKWTRTPNGATSVWIKFNYILTDVDGELHAPKDENKRELGLGAAIEAAMRQRVLFDVQRMMERGFPMASGWYRQLGLETSARAMVVVEAETAGKRPSRSSLVTPIEVQKKGHFLINQILEERASTGKAKAYFLVQWEGYHPTWEKWRIVGQVGDPVATWETLAVVQGTEALVAWRSRLSLE